MLSSRGDHAQALRPRDDPKNSGGWTIKDSPMLFQGTSKAQFGAIDRPCQYDPGAACKMNAALREPSRLTAEKDFYR